MRYFMTVTVDRSVEEFTAAPRKLFIDGQWTDAASARRSRHRTRLPERPSPTWPRETPKTSTGPSCAARKAFDERPVEPHDPF